MKDRRMAQSINQLAGGIHLAVVRNAHGPPRILVQAGI